MINLPKSAIRVMLSIFVIWIGISLNWLVLNFHLEAQGFNRTFIGLANATPAIATIAVGIPAGFLTPRFGYIKSLILGSGIASIGQLLIAWSPNSGVVLIGLLGLGIGQALIIGTVAPLLTLLTPKRLHMLVLSWQSVLGITAGFFGNMIGGFLPRFLESPGQIIYVAAGVFVLAIIPLWTMTGETASHIRRFHCKDPHLWARLLAPQILIALGAGAIIPFLNLYLADKFGLALLGIGALFAFSSLSTLAAVLYQPALIRRFGKAGAIITNQTASLPFIVVIAYLPFLPVVAVALLARNALMNATHPVYTSLSMELLPPEERATFIIAGQIVWNIGWAVSAIASGYLQMALGLPAFHILFAWMLLTYGTATIYYLRVFYVNAAEPSLS